MDPKPQTEYEQWFEKARDDELSAVDILEDKHGSPNTVCFLSQQMAEKYLKGLAVFYNEVPPRTHDLLQLESFLLKKGGENSEIKTYEAELDTLNDYYIETRYPGDYPEFHWGDAEEALAAAQKIKRFVLDRTATE